jgi:hypothetical protein
MRPAPRVRCDGCHHEWFSPTSAHGLRVLGRCPRCDSTLSFLEPDEPESPAPADDALVGVAPAAVLGRPSGWAH